MVCLDFSFKASSLKNSSSINENRYRMLKMMNPEHADELMAQAQADVNKSWKFLEGRFKALEPED